MNIVKPLSIVFLTIITLSSCRKNIENSSDSGDLTLKKVMALYGSPEPHSNFIVISSQQLANYFDSVNSYDILAYASFSNNGAYVNNGPISINNRVITADSQNDYEFNYNDNNVLEEGKSLLGSTVNIEATKPGTNIKSNAIINIPNAIFSSRQYYPNSTIDKAANLLLNWDADSINQFKKVDIQMSYYKGLSQSNATGMPDSVEPLFYEVDDNGSFTIPQADLAAFPKGSYVGISITRAACNNTSGDNITYISIVEAHSIPILIMDSHH